MSHLDLPNQTVFTIEILNAAELMTAFFTTSSNQFFDPYVYHLHTVGL